MAKRRGLKRETVVERAVEMADTAGKLEMVTLTALAYSLGIQVPSLSNHIANLNDLHQAMAVYAARRLIDRVRTAAAGQVGREALLSMANAYRQFAHEHPGIYPLTLRAPEPDDQILSALGQELLQMLLLVLASFGLQGEEALHAVRGIRSLLHGFVALEAAEGFKMQLGREDSYHRMVNTYLDGLECNR